LQKSEILPIIYLSRGLLSTQFYYQCI